MTEPITVALTPPEEQLLALIREGRVDAEIAVRLGITNRDVKERVERLAAKLGARDRAELRDGPRPDEPEPPPEERPFAEGLVLTRAPRGPLYPALFALAFVAAAAFMVLAFLWPSDRASTPAAQPTTTTAASTTAAPPLAAPIVSIAGREMISLGPIFAGRNPGSALVRAGAREDLLVVETSGGAIVAAAGWRVEYASLTEFSLSRQIGVQRVYVAFQAVESTGFTRGGGGDAAAFAVTSTTEALPTFVAWATMESGARLHLELDVAGTLYVAPAPIAGDKVIVNATGETLDVGEAKALAKVPVTTAFSVVNDCDVRAERCQAFVYADGPPSNPVTFLVPVDGTLTCSDDGVLQLEAVSFRLFFQQVDRTGKDLFGCYPPSSAASDPKGRAREVHAGQILSQSTHYRITAETLAGAPLSVVVANDRTIHVGDITPKYGCPCRTAN